jgi:peroxiredoxin
MKKNYFLFVIFFMIFSCQEEKNEIIQNNEEAISSTSPLTKLITRVVQNPSSEDNILDNSSCFSVRLPVTVTVNSQVITLNSDADYQNVENAINAYSNDDDIIYFSYPITIVYENFSSAIINNYNELHDAIENCEVEDGFDEIDCISINFPVSINVYNSNNQVANTVTLQSNSAMYNFLDNLEDNVFVAIVYPISVTNSNGQNVLIASNSELENFIESSIDDCDDDIGGGNQPELTAVLTSGTWYISYCLYNNQDDTYYYNGYNFTFNTNGTVVAVKNATTIYGDWDIEIDGSYKKLRLHFDGNTFDEIEEDWKVNEFTETNIRTRHGDVGTDPIDYLYFTKN